MRKKIILVIGRQELKHPCRQSNAKTLEFERNAAFKGYSGHWIVRILAPGRSINAKGRIFYTGQIIYPKENSRF